ncbi:C-C motif chemokine 19-like [Odontesthes bonariensis]|uniref:C-C motif chemokine 19-like n=1 Tax=Odontesthes bonariensis TaxID=219752 RepID=UPI003F58E9E9
MAPRDITVATVLLSFTLGILSPAPAACVLMNRGCCTSYNRRPVPFQYIVGYREQPIKENCRIEAIIFYTINKNVICASQKDEWVKKALKLLSSKLKKMSKANSSASGAPLKKPGQLPVHDGSGSFLSTTEASFNNTGSFY